jgi:hypothetical protein
MCKITLKTNVLGAMRRETEMPICSFMKKSNHKYMEPVSLNSLKKID